MENEERYACRTPIDGQNGVTFIATWKYRTLRRAILHAVEGAGAEGLPVSKLTGAVKERISAGELSRLGSLGWHCTTVKLEMEAAGEIGGLENSDALRLVRKPG